MQDIESQTREDTTSTILRWGGAGLTFVTFLAAIVLYASSMKADIASQKVEIDTLKRTVDMNRVEDEKRIEVNAKRINDQDNSIQQLTTKLEVAIALLTRIDNKLKNP